MAQVLEQLAQIRREVRDFRDTGKIKKSGLSFKKEIANGADLLNVLTAHGYSSLALYLHENFKIHSVGFPEIVISEMPGKSPRDISGEVAEAVRSVTDRPYNVTFLPF